MILIPAVALTLVLFGSLVPGRYRPKSGLGSHIEHALAYSVAGISLFPFTALIVPLWMYLSAWVLFAAVMELSQLWIPDRSARFSHFLASCAGISFSVILGLLTAQ